MSRFSEPQDPVFRALNTSVGFDYRLAPFDLDQSLAHARMLARAEIISAEDLAELERGLAAVRERWSRGTSRSTRTTRTSTWRSSAA